MSPPAPAFPWLGVVGHPVAHSVSPRLHEAGLAALGTPGASVAVDVGPHLLADVLRWFAAAGWTGCNVTAPHKEGALLAASTATEAARRAGAANCLRRAGGGYEATNTDGAGFLAFLEEAGLAASGQGVVILGAGGAAAGLAPALSDAGARVSLIARCVPRASALAGLRGIPVAAWNGEEARRALAEAALVVNATPLGAAPTDPLPCAPERLDARCVGVDLRYGPTPSPWVVALRASGRRAHDGVGLLLHQCALSFVYWFDAAPPLARLREAVPWPDSRNPRTP